MSYINFLANRFDYMYSLSHIGCWRRVVHVSHTACHAHCPVLEWDPSACLWTVWVTLTIPSTTYSITHCTQLPLPLALRAPVPEFPEAEGHVLDLSMLPADKLEGADSKTNSLGRADILSSLGQKPYNLLCLIQEDYAMLQSGSRSNADFLHATLPFSMQKNLPLFTGIL